MGSSQRFSSPIRLPTRLASRAPQLNGRAARTLCAARSGAGNAVPAHVAAGEALARVVPLPSTAPTWHPRRRCEAPCRHAWRHAARRRRRARRCAHAGVRAGTARGAAGAARGEVFDVLEPARARGRGAPLAVVARATARPAEVAGSKHERAHHRALDRCQGRRRRKLPACAGGACRRARGRAGARRRAAHLARARSRASACARPSPSAPTRRGRTCAGPSARARARRCGACGTTRCCAQGRKGAAGSAARGRSTCRRRSTRRRTRARTHPVRARPPRRTLRGASILGCVPRP